MEREPDAVIQKPRGFLCDSKIPRDLATADAILAVHDKPESAEPFIQPDRGILKDGSDL
jgi:hypothetical protein